MCDSADEEDRTDENDQISDNNDRDDIIDDLGVRVIRDTYCSICNGSGTTRLMLHTIPHFRQLIIASFSCDECFTKNNEVTFGGEVQITGCEFQLTVSTSRDLDRQIIKSDSATIRIPEIDFEIPPLTQKGEISTIEGVLKTAAKNLSMFQPQRLVENPVVGLRVGQIILRLNEMCSGEEEYLPFTIILNDPAGNSFIQNFMSPAPDPQLILRNYMRTPDQDRSLGFQPETATYRDDTDSNLRALIPASGNAVFGMTKDENPSNQDSSMRTTSTEADGSGGNSTEEFEFIRLGRTEVISIASHCPSCNALGDSLTALTDIPHFKEVIIMAFDCKSCGFRSSEVKGGGAIPSLGTEVWLTVTSEEDLKRDLLKSDSAMVFIPELDLELQHGTLGGLFTTVEGLLNKIHKNLCEQNPFMLGDSSVMHHSNDVAVGEVRGNFMKFLDQLSLCASGKRFPFTIKLRDPLGNSFISAPLGSFLPPEQDKNLVIQNFVRTFEENEEFGLNDMSTSAFETGVDSTYALPVPVDPQVYLGNYTKGPDHPTYFAKGVYENDNTVGGKCYKLCAPIVPVSAIPVKDTVVAEQVVGHGTAEVGSEDAHYYKPPPGWSVERVTTVDSSSSSISSSVDAEVTEDGNGFPFSARREFNDDSRLDFDPREEFAGRRPGYVFRLGSKGIGYYQDRKI